MANLDFKTWRLSWIIWVDTVSSEGSFKVEEGDQKSQCQSDTTRKPWAIAAGSEDGRADSQKLEKTGNDFSPEPLENADLLTP